MGLYKAGYCYWRRGIVLTGAREARSLPTLTKSVRSELEKNCYFSYQSIVVHHPDAQH